MEDIIVSSGVMTPQCYRVFFENMNFLDLNTLSDQSYSLEDTACLKLLLSKVLGYLVITGSMGVKIPQILTIVRSGSAAGISLSMFVLELIGLTISLGYNYLRGNPFSTWGETFFLLVQTVILLALILHYSKAIGLKSLAAAGLWMAALGAIATRQISAEQIALIQPASIAIFVMSKVPQVITNFKTRSTGKLALITFFLNTAGGAARIFTTLQEVADPMLLTSVLIGFSLNLTITLQIIFFGDKEAKLAATNSKISSHPAPIDGMGRSGPIELSRHRVASDAGDQRHLKIVSPTPAPAYGNSPILDSHISSASSPSLGTDDSEEVHAMDTDSSDDSSDDSSEEATTDETTSMPSSSPRINTSSSSTSEDAVFHAPTTSSQKKIAKILGEDPGLSASEESGSAPPKKDKKDKKDKKAGKEAKEREKREKKDRKKAEKEEEKRKKKAKD